MSKNIKLRSTKVFVINLHTDVQRRKSALDTLSVHGFEDVTVFPAISHSDPVIGCALSHAAILELMLRSNAPFMILEDDVEIHKFRPEIEVPDDTDAVYLGNSDYGLSSGVGKKRICVEREHQDLFRCYNMLGAHAILYLSNPYVRQLFQASKFAIDHGEGIDKVMAEIMKYWKIRAFEEPVFRQSGEHRSSTQTNLAKHDSVGPDRAFTGMGRIQILGKVLL